MKRPYTASEIDALRRAVELRWLFGTTKQSAQAGMSRGYRAEEKEAAVEERVRTYMLAGITADDIYAQDHGMTTEQWRDRHARKGE